MISEETSRYTQDVCHEVIRSLRESPRKQEQIQPEMVAEHLDNLKAAAAEYASAMKAMKPEELAEQAADAVTAIAEQLRAFTALAKNLPAPNVAQAPPKE